MILYITSESCFKNGYVDAAPPKEEKPMAAKIKPVPDGYHTVTPYLVVSNAGKAIEYYKEAFGATGLNKVAGGRE
jgi:hypothetical protein